MHVRRIQAFRLCKQFWGMTRPPLKGRKPQILALPMAGRTKLETRAGLAKEIPRDGRKPVLKSHFQAIEK